MRDIARKLKRKLKPTDKVERCGLILKDGRAFQTENMHGQPTNGFIIAGADLLAHEADLLGTWHTHPASPATLSQEDYNGFRNWPQLTHFIIGTDGVRAYRLDAGVVTEIDIAAG
jgi:proteasome lid subunit RPN8/RPN11